EARPTDCWKRRRHSPSATLVPVRSTLCCRALTKSDLDILPVGAGAADHRDGHLAAGRLADELTGQVASRGHVMPIDRDDDVAYLDASLLCRALAGGVIGEIGDQHT